MNNPKTIDMIFDCEDNKEATLNISCNFENEINDNDSHIFYFILESLSKHGICILIFYDYEYSLYDKIKNILKKVIDQYFVNQFTNYYNDSSQLYFKILKQNETIDYRKVIKFKIIISMSGQKILDQQNQSEYIENQDEEQPSFHDEEESSDYDLPF